ncbi:MAG TPA: hypothetical protein VMN76_08490 [Acidobacteriota bacterium]|nr:hypothetical protein [Acidobacteriota bacterium]
MKSEAGARPEVSAALDWTPSSHKAEVYPKTIDRENRDPAEPSRNGLGAPWIRDGIHCAEAQLKGLARGAVFREGGGGVQPLIPFDAAGE